MARPKSYETKQYKMFTLSNEAVEALQTLAYESHQSMSAYIESIIMAKYRTYQRKQEKQNADN